MNWKKILYIVTLVLIILVFIGTIIFDMIAVITGMTGPIINSFTIYTTLFVLEIPLLIMIAFLMKELYTDKKEFIKRSIINIAILFAVSIFMKIIQVIFNNYFQKKVNEMMISEPIFRSSFSYSLINSFYIFIIMSVILSITLALFYFLFLRLKDTNNNLEKML